MVLADTYYDQRRHPRVPVRAPAQLEFGWEEPWTGEVANLSFGGMFVEDKNPRPVGSLLRFAVTLPGGWQVRGYAEVAWIRVRSEGPMDKAGMGIRFRHLEEADRQALEGFLLSVLGS